MFGEWSGIVGERGRRFSRVGPAGERWSGPWPCFRGWIVAGKSEKSEKNPGGRPKGSGLLKALDQLAAVRKAAQVKMGEAHDDPEVMIYVRLRDEDVKSFTALRERLEKENRENRRRVAGERLLKETGGGGALPGKLDDGYDRSADEVTPRLERLIEAWLAETRARVEAMP